MLKGALVGENKPMDWVQKLLDTALQGMPSAVIALIPEHLRKQWQERLGDYLPFKDISANHDLVRATRLAWIDAAQMILREAQTATSAVLERQDAAVRDFHPIILEALLDARDVALDRRNHPGQSPIDDDVAAIVAGVPELIAPGEHAGIGQSVTSRFVVALSGLSGWPVAEIPPIYARIAAEGLVTGDSGPRRPFGELVFAAFAEIIKNPARYPQAREAFLISMDKLGRELSQATLAAVEGMSERLDAALATIDTANLLRGATELRLLPGIAENVERTRAGTEQILSVLSREAGVPHHALEAILREMDGGTTAEGPATDTMERLAGRARDFRRLTDRLNRLSNADPAVTELRREAATALSDGRFTEADARLASAEALDLAGLEDLESLAQQKRLSAAQSRAERAAAAALRGNVTAYREAILHYLEAERIAGPASRDAAIDYRAQRANVLMMLGEAEGYPASTREAVALFRTLLGEVDPARSGELYGGLLNAMGSALLVLGSQESSRAAFDEALASFVKALPYRAGSASDRAETQFKIGLAHTALGNLFDDREQLALAAAAHRAALDALPPGEHSFIRSMVTGQHALLTIRLGQPDQAPQLLNEAIASIEATPSGSDEPAVNSLILRNQLGIALHELGKRTGDIAYLERAATIFRDVAADIDPAGAPLFLCRCAINRAVCLQDLATRTEQAAPLRLAAQELRAHLDNPAFNWPPSERLTAEIKLGTLYREIGTMEKSIDFLEASLQVLGDHLAGLDSPSESETAGYDLSSAHHELGVTQRAVYNLQQHQPSLEGAIASFRSALLYPARNPARPEATRTQLAQALSALGSDREDADLLGEAATISRSLLTEDIRERNLSLWRNNQTNLAITLVSWARPLPRAAAEPLLEEAIAALRLALSVSDESNRTDTMHNLGRALELLGSRRDDREMLEESVAIYERLLADYPASDPAIRHMRAKRNYAQALLELGHLEKGTDNLIRAISQLEAVVAFFKRDEFPEEWRNAYLGIGRCYMEMAHRADGANEESAALWTGAIDALTIALEVTTRAERVFWIDITERLSRSLCQRIEATGDERDFPLAIVHARAGLEIVDPVRETWSATSLQNTLGMALRKVGAKTGDIGMLREAVAAQRAAVACEPAGSSQISGLLQNLALALSILGSHEPGGESLAEAAEMFRQSLATRVEGSANRELTAVLMDYGSTVRHLWDHSQNVADLDESMDAYARAASLCQPMTSSWGTAQHGRGVALRIKGQVTEDADLLQQAVGAFDQAIECRFALGEADNLANSRNSLGYALMVLGGMRDDGPTLQRAVDTLREAVAGDGQSYAVRFNLANGLTLLADHVPGLVHLQEASAVLIGMLRTLPPHENGRRAGCQELLDEVTQRILGRQFSMGLS